MSEPRRIQHELAILMHSSKAVARNVHRLQHQLLSEQGAAKLRIDETKRSIGDNFQQAFHGLLDDRGHRASGAARRRERADGQTSD